MFFMLDIKFLEKKYSNCLFFKKKIEIEKKMDNGDFINWIPAFDEIYTSDSSAIFDLRHTSYV